MLGAGWASNLALSLVGAVFFVMGILGWIEQMLPGRGHMHEPLVDPSLRRREIVGEPGTVDQLKPGMAGYRFQLPESFHPISAGVKGGLVGGLVMPIPALAYGLLSGHGLWFPINLLAGIVVPGISGETEAQLESFQLGAARRGDRYPRHVLAHVRPAFRRCLADFAPDSWRPGDRRRRADASLVDGLVSQLYGHRQPIAPKHVNWSWFIVSQAVYGLAMSIVVVRSQKVSSRRPAAARRAAADSGFEPGRRSPVKLR